MIQNLRSCDCDKTLKDLGDKWCDYFGEKKLTTECSEFWTLPVCFHEMKKEHPALYEHLEEAKFVIFKGDLNYRKLCGEVNWDPTFPFAKALQGFLPTNLCVLRTIKCELIVGLPQGKAEELDGKDVNWMTSGNFGVMQYAGQLYDTNGKCKCTN